MNTGRRGRCFLFPFGLGVLMAAAAASATAERVEFTREYWRYHWTFRPARFLSTRAELIAIPTRYAAKNALPSGNQLTTSGPPEGWERADFDDSAWCVSRAPLPMLPDIDQDGEGPYSAHIIRRMCARSRFVVPDPARVRRLKLELGYYGGIIVYVNGREVARGHIAPDGLLAKELFAEPYPKEAYGPVSEEQRTWGLSRDGWWDRGTVYHPWRWDGKPDEQVMHERVAHIAGVRERRSSVDVPGKLLRRGVNLVAVDNRLSPFTELETRRKGRTTVPANRDRWPHIGISKLELNAGSAGSVRAVSRPNGIQAWAEDIHRWLLEEDFLEPGVRERRTVDIIGARGGTHSGQVVVGTSDDLANPAAAITDLAGPGGARIPAARVQLRWARSIPVKLIKQTNQGAFRTYMQDLCLIRYRGAPADTWVAQWVDHRGEMRLISSLWAKAAIRIYDQLAPEPPARIAAGTSQPLWLTVEIPNDAPPGPYTGVLTVRAGDTKEARFDVKLEVADWTPPAPKSYVSYVGIDESPWALAAWCKVEPWSEEHWRLVEQSIQWAGKLGARLVGIPVIQRTELNNSTDTMIKWIRKQDGSYDYDSSLADRYLDLWRRYCHPDSDVIIYIVRPAEHYARGTGTGTVNVVDPATGATVEFTPPQPDTAEGLRLWVDCAKAIRAHFRARGLKDRNLHWGMPYDYADNRTKALAAVLAGEIPGIGWARSCHTGHNPFHNNEGKITWHAAVRHYQSPPFLLPRKKGGPHFYFDPSGYRVHSYHGWSDPGAMLLLPRADSDVTALGVYPPLYQLRELMEMPVTSQYRGVARISVDGWARGGYFGPFNPHLVYPGRHGMDGSIQFEILREGLQETETRIAIVKRDIPSPEVQKLLDRRTERAWVLPPRPEGQRISEYYAGWQELSLGLYRAAAAESKRKPPGAADWAQRLASGDKDLRARAAWALGNMGAQAREAAESLARALKDPEREVRSEATKALAKMGEAAAPALAKALEDSDANARAGAAAALGGLGRAASPAVHELAAALRDESKEVRLASADALGRIGPEAVAAVPALAQSLKDSEWEVGERAAAALGWIGPKAQAAVPALAEALDHNDARVRRSAAEALLKIGRGAKGAVQALMAALKDGDKHVRAAAAAALGAIGPDAGDSTELLCGLVKDSYYLARYNALIALGRIGPRAKAAIPLLTELAKRGDWFARDALNKVEK